MAKVTWRGGALIAPVPPAMISCGTMEQSNIITVAWTGILGTVPPKTYISVRPRRHSYNIIKESGEFVINLPTQQLIRAVDYCGVKSGRNTDKFKEMNLSAEPAEEISAPILAQSPVNIECKVRDIVELGTHHMFIADIVSLSVAKELLDNAGKLHLDKANLIAYAHGEYFALGKKLGTFGYSVRKKKTKKKSSR